MNEPRRSERRTPYTGINLPTSVKDDLNLMSLNLSAKLGRRVSMATFMAAALTLADRHPDEIEEIVSGPNR